MRHYKKKYHMDCNDLDFKPKKMKCYEATNRQDAQRQIKKELNELEEHDIKKLRHDIEMQMSWDCYQKEKEAVRKGEPYNCTCSDPMKWSDEEVLKWHGFR